MTAAGKCTNSSNKCFVNTFCPATSAEEESCKACDASITSGKGCSCVADTPITNCMTCRNNKCTKCISQFILKTDGSGCDACSADCLNCSSSTVCTKCNPGYYLDKSTDSCVICSDNNCTSCSSATTCTACQNNFVAINNKCETACDARNPCQNQYFCDPKTSSCVKCTTGCSHCKSATICSACSGNKNPNIYGVCEEKCAVAITDGQYCKDGKVENCASGITSECTCKNSSFCASCTDDKVKCKTCLSGYKMVGDKCQQCADGFESFDSLCVKIVNFCSAECLVCLNSSICTKCKTGFYIDQSIKDCKPCTDSNCTSCTAAATCTACKNSFVAINNKCAAACNDSKPCQNKEFCDTKTNSCAQCETGCSYCKSETICGACENSNLSVNIYGICEESCRTVNAGEYCKNGVTMPCAEGITSECYCGAGVQFCGSCTADKKSCATCLPGFKMVGQRCVPCDDGYELFAGLCLKTGSSDSAKLSGGAIAAIVIGAIVVVGGVSGGIAYYLIRKQKADRVVPSHTFSVQ